MALSYCSFSSQQDCFTQTQLFAAEDEFLCFNGDFNYFTSDHSIDDSPFCLSQDAFGHPNALQIPAQLPEFEAPTSGFCEGRRDDNTMKKQRNLSAQSIAARERRRKIMDGTHELGKLVPGGNKMNTAEMLSSAFSYVKFLQAQLHILQLMHQFQTPNRFLINQLQVLVLSTKIQQKLYSQQKCLVPTEFLRSIPNHTDFI